jgi:hypothetical protein
MFPDVMMQKPAGGLDAPGDVTPCIRHLPFFIAPFLQGFPGVPPLSVPFIQISKIPECNPTANSTQTGIWRASAVGPIALKEQR